MEKRKFIAEQSAEIKACQEQINKLLMRAESDWFTTPIRPKGWSPLEVLNHLQLANEYYIDCIIGYFKSAERSDSDIHLSFWDKQISSIINGNHPLVGKLKLPSPKMFKPRRSNESWDISASLEEFNDQLELILNLLHQSENFDLSKSVIPVPFFKLLQITPAGAFNIMVCHLRRHFKQIPFETYK